MCKGLLIKQLKLIIIGLLGINSLAAVYMTNTNFAFISIGNDTYYEIGIDKNNGGISYILDKTAGAKVCQGSRYSVLWGALFAGSSNIYEGAGSYYSGGDNQFSRQWYAESNMLVLDYKGDPLAAHRVDAEVTMVFSGDNWFDMQLVISNGWGKALENVLFPSDLVFKEDDIQELLLPLMPGIILKPSFFDKDYSFTTRYPGWPGVCSDFVSYVTASGNMAVYSYYNRTNVFPVLIGPVHDDAYIPDSTYYNHSFYCYRDNSEVWYSPVVRIRLGAAHDQAIEAFRQDNAFDQVTPLRNKLGSLYEKTATAVNYKMDAFHLGLPFSNYNAFLKSVPPGILHLVAFQRDGHDENYPDFFPPDPAFGNTAEMISMSKKAQSNGFLIMPYSNPTFWDDESETVQNMNITNAAVLDSDGQPRYETYGATHGGYAMCAYAPAVVSRLQEFIDDFTVTFPSDMLFEDQIGARAFIYDYNPAAPDAASYLKGWINHTARFADCLLHTEMGFDRLLETECGFHGTVNLVDVRGDFSIPSADFSYYPFTGILARDKVFFYQHDLAMQTTVTNKYNFLFHFAYGLQLHYDLAVMGTNNQWLAVNAAFQKHVLSAYADERVTAFTRIGNITKTALENYQVTVNWGSTSYSDGLYTISGSGCLVEGNNASLRAGIFRAYNGQPLSAGDHFIIEKRYTNKIKLYHPAGDDTFISLSRPAEWVADTHIKGRVLNRQEQIIASFTPVISADNIIFKYETSVEGQQADSYQCYYTLPLVKNDSDPAAAAVFRIVPARIGRETDTALIAAIPPGAKQVKVYTLAGNLKTVLYPQYSYTLNNNSAYQLINWNLQDKYNRRLDTGVYLLEADSKTCMLVMQ